MHDLLGLPTKELSDLMVGWGEKPFRARQIVRWVHQRGVADFSDMTDLAKATRAAMADRLHVGEAAILRDSIARDGTRKWLFDVGEGNAIESVFIPERTRGTLCISSQAGCAVNCSFCSTGAQGFSRNLSAAEIVSQVWVALNKLDGFRVNGMPEQRAVSNVVFMGMGEPLQNYAQVLRALRLLLDDNAYGLSRRRVTVSTSGVVPMMDRLGADCPVALAVSLHAPNDALRDQLVPLNRKYPLAELMSACRRYLEVAPRDFITFEYVMIKGVNDSLSDAHALRELVRDVPCKFNLIPFNPFPGSGLERSSADQIQRFSQVLSASGIVTTVRRTRGDDIDAACGQLAGEVQDRTRVSERRARVTMLREERQ